MLAHSIFLNNLFYLTHTQKRLPNKHAPQDIQQKHRKNQLPTTLHIIKTFQETTNKRSAQSNPPLTIEQRTNIP